MTNTDTTTAPQPKLTAEEKAAQAKALQAAEDARRRNIRIKFDAKLLRLLSPFIPKTDIRHYMCGLRVERAADKDKGIYLVATNGHMLAVYYDPDGQIVGDEGRGCILRLTPAMLSAARARRHELKVVVSGLRASVATDFGGDAHDNSVTETYIMPGNPYVNGTYPEWRNVLPVFNRLSGSVHVEVQPKYLAVFAGLCSHKFAGMKLWQSVDNSFGALVVQLPEHPNFVGIVMPFRLDAQRDAMKPVFDACKPAA